MSEQHVRRAGGGKRYHKPYSFNAHCDSVGSADRYWDQPINKRRTLNNNSSVVAFVKKGILPELHDNGIPSFYFGVRPLASPLSSLGISDGIFFDSGDAFPSVSIKDMKYQPPVGVIPASGPRKTKESRESENLVIMNGDENYNGLVPLFPGFPTVSFHCLRRLTRSLPEDKKPPKWNLSDKEIDCQFEIARMFVEDNLQLKDWVPDSTIPLKASEKKQMIKYINSYSKVNKNGKPIIAPVPPVGYSYVSPNWHRAATVLIYNVEDDCSYLIGQDEDTYFGVELVCNPSTIEEAFVSLMPTNIRKIKGVKRQGEWFAVPVSKEQLPSANNCSIFNDIILPREDDNSNSHTLCDGRFSYGEDVMTGFISNDGRIFSYGGELNHPEHATLHLDSKIWYTFVKNTAKRSVSIAGVD